MAHAHVSRRSAVPNGHWPRATQSHIIEQPILTPVRNRSEGRRHDARPLASHVRRDDACFPLKLSRAWARSGWYPSEYCLRYRENRDELTTSMEGFVYRQGS